LTSGILIFGGSTFTTGGGGSGFGIILGRIGSIGFGGRDRVTSVNL
jgi:hypothetical protein